MTIKCSMSHWFQWLFILTTKLVGFGVGRHDTSHGSGLGEHDPIYHLWLKHNLTAMHLCAHLCRTPWRTPWRLNDLLVVVSSPQEQSKITTPVKRNFFIFLLFCTGLRGAVSFALSLHLEVENEVRHVLVTTTLIIVLFTILFLGGSTMPMMKVHCSLSVLKMYTWWPMHSFTC